MTSTTSDKVGLLRPMLRGRWSRLSLAGQFALAGALVLLAGMVAISVWVTRQIEEGVTRNTAAATALYMASFVEPVVQELATSYQLSPENEAALDELHQTTALGRRVISFKIWKEGGLIAYSSRKDIIGKVFEPTPNLRAAWSGAVTAEFDTLEDEEDAEERAAGVPLLEIYSPIREYGTGHIIAVAEFYETAEALQENLFRAYLRSWLVVGVVTLTMFGMLASIVLRGSRTIDHQRETLEERVGELSQLLTQNVELRDRAHRASRRAAEINEQYLRRIGADLHDGPAQLLALAALRLDSLEPLLADSPRASDGRSDIEVVRESLADALTDIRDISAGLTLPELESMTPTALLENAAKAHERRTETKVALDIHSAPGHLDQPLKICIYRFAQEALSNAFRHGGGKDQHLSCRVDGDMLEVTVSDSGPGFDPSKKSEASHGLGLPGLRERIESFGGSLQVVSAPGEGARLVMRCEMKA